MKVIEALKKLTDLARKAEDLRGKISGSTAIMDFQKPEYIPEGEAAPFPSMTKQIKSWTDAHKDVLQERMNLSLAIQRTNLAVEATVLFTDGTAATRPISEWILRRRSLAMEELTLWKHVNDCGLKTTAIQKQGQEEPVIAHVIRFYSPEERDKMLEKLTEEHSLIDAALEISNATTDLIE